MRRHHFHQRRTDVDRKYVVVVADRRRGTFAYRGEGTEAEVKSDVETLIETKDVPPRNIAILPVKGKPREELGMTNKEVGILVALTVVIAGGIGFWVAKRLEQKKKKKKMLMENHTK